MSWDLIGWAVAGLVLSVAVGIGRAVSEEIRGRAALRDARGGSFVAQPMRIVPLGGVAWWLRAIGHTSGRAYRDGADLVLMRSGGPVRLPLGDLARARVRTTVSEETETTREVFTLVDVSGSAYELQVPDYVSPGLTAVAAVPPRAATATDRLRSAVPWRVLLAAALLALPFAVHQVAWHTGHDVGATVREVDESGAVCTVEWTAAERRHQAGVDCYEPYPAVGETLTVRAMTGPLSGQAMDHEGSYDAGLALLGGPVLLLLVTAALGTGLRLRGPVLHLRAPAAASGHVAEPSPEPVHLTLRELATEVARREGWADGPFGRGFVMSPPARLRTALVSWPLGAAAGALFVAWVLPEESPRPWSWPLTGLAALGIGYAVLATVQTVRLILEPVGAVGDRAVDILTVRSVTDDWAVLLFNPGAAVPAWLVPFPAQARPPLAAQAVARGDLEAGAAVRLVIDDASWEPVGPVTEIDDDLRAEILADLRERLELAPGAPWWEGYPVADQGD